MCQARGWVLYNIAHESTPSALVPTPHSYYAPEIQHKQIGNLVNSSREIAGSYPEG